MPEDKGTAKWVTGQASQELCPWNVSFAKPVPRCSARSWPGAADLDAILLAFGFARRGRHWVLDDIVVQAPGNWKSDPVELVAVGSLSLRVVWKAIVLADRIIGSKHWRARVLALKRGVVGEDEVVSALRRPAEPRVP